MSASNTSDNRAVFGQPIRDDLGLALRRLLPTVFQGRCPACTKGRIAKNYFALEKTCSNCGARYERDPGSFLALIALNYLVTVIVTLAVAFALILNYGFFPGVTYVLLAVGLVTMIGVYKPVKALYLWILWLFGFVYPD